MSDKSEIRSGIFVLVGLLVFAVCSLWIAGYDPMSSRRAPYQILMKSAGGVRAGDMLRLSGVEVGRIEGLVLTPGTEWPVSFQVAVDGDVAIVAGTSARFAGDGLLSSIYLDLVSGPETAELLPAGTQIYGTEGGTINDLFLGMGDTAKRLNRLIDESSRVLAEVSTELVPTLQRARALMSEENAESLSGALGALRDTFETTGPLIPPLLTRLDTVAVGLEAGIENFPLLTEEIGVTLSALKNALGEDGRRLTEVLDAAEAALTSASETFGVVEGQAAHLEETLNNLRETSAHLKAFSEAVRSKPSLLLRSSRRPDRKPGEGADR